MQVAEDEEEAVFARGGAGAFLVKVEAGENEMGPLVCTWHGISCQMVEVCGEDSRLCSAERGAQTFCSHGVYAKAVERYYAGTMP